MHLQNLIAIVLTAAPVVVTAAGTLGFSVGNVNPDGSCKKQADFEADFAAIKDSTFSTLVRTYSSSDQWGNACNTPSEILPAAKKAGIKVLLGMWPDGGVYQKEKAFIEDANVEQYGDTLYGITVGSEGMYRGTYKADDLIGWIGDMKKSFPNTKIGSADSWNCWANGTMDGIIKSGIDLV